MHFDAGLREGRRYKRVLQWVLETREASGELMPLVAPRNALFLDHV